MTDEASLTAFIGHRRVASGPILVVAEALAAIDPADGSPLIFDDVTGSRVELDLRFGAAQAANEFRARTAPLQPPSTTRVRGRGRPRLGVVAREVTLLPRHWDWLAGQPGGASATLRRLVDEARRGRGESDRSRVARDAAYRVMSALGGDLPGFEEASRALFAGDAGRLSSALAGWPPDVRTYVLSFIQAEG